MHTFSETGAGVPAFLAKLWRLVDDPETNNLICWSKDGRSFIIQNQAQFARELLPLNYKHNNMASFIRQLNMYGFHKITSIDNGGLKFDRDEMEFSHPCFKRNCPHLVEHIKRKIANTKTFDDKSAIKPEAVSRVLQDVKAMRGRQDSLDSRFSVMKQENEALWREIASLRQKHAKQQQIVNKLIQFLITIVQPSRNMTGVKRHIQLMINDTPENIKIRNSSESDPECGPVIHELGEELLDEVAENDVDLMDEATPYVKLDGTEDVERPHSSVSLNYDYSNQSIDDALNAVPTTTRNANNSSTATANAADAVVHSIGPDGMKILYHVTEVPDTHTQETKTVAPTSYNEENVLTTPLVRKEMARTRTQLKQKNKQRRKEADIQTTVNSATAPVKIQQMSFDQAAAAPTNTSGTASIKSENEIDPMIYLNVFPDNRVQMVSTPDPRLISPNLSEDSHQSLMNAGNIGGTVTNVSTTATDAALMTTAPDLYNADNFITGEMPADIFEDSSLMAGDNSNFSDNFKLNQQQQFGRTTAAGGKFSSYIAGSNNNNNNNGTTSANGASTSAAAAAAAAIANTTASATNGASTSGGKQRSLAQGKNINNMTVAKYKTGTNNHEEVMRDEVHGHLETVQDELESLKDLLRSDGYSLDTNTLMGPGTSSPLMSSNNRIHFSQTPLDADFFNKLFNDSELLGPYGLSFEPQDGSNNKKGSELITYQPVYDLSDIIDINDKNELENAESANNADVTPSGSRQKQLQTQRSVLNTPRHE